MYAYPPPPTISMHILKLYVSHQPFLESKQFIYKHLSHSNLQNIFARKKSKIIKLYNKNKNNNNINFKIKTY